MPDREWWQALWPDPAVVLRAVGIEEWMAVLDLCCGDGYFTAPLSRLVRGRAYGVDLDPAMLERAQQEIGRTGAPACRLIEADAADLARLLPEKMDYVLLANTFHGVPDKTKLAEAVQHMLKPQGLFAIINWYPKPREQTPVLGKPRGPPTDMRMSPEDVQRVVNRAGFSLKRVVDLPPHHYGAVFQRD
ncbi:MAG: class I SAM-dependent methyltransferase [Betaproteobacteria bacterium]|nr:class I SAM-dependent methyltransferase [Betaproteobacteria bacterium]